MDPPITAVGSAMDGLKTIIAARNILGLDGVNRVPLHIGWPPGGPEPEHIWIQGDVEGWTQEQEVTGDMATAPREEAFALKVVVHVEQATADFLVVRDRALVFIREIGLALRNSFTVGGSVFEGEISGGEAAEGWTEETRSYTVVLKVSILAYLLG